MENQAARQILRENEAYKPIDAPPSGRTAEELAAVYPGMGPELAALSPAARALLGFMVAALAPTYDYAINRAELAHMLGKVRLTPGDLKRLAVLRAWGFVIEADRGLSGGGRLLEYRIKRVVLPPLPPRSETIEERLTHMRAALHPPGTPVRAASVVQARTPARRWHNITRLQIAVLTALALVLVVALVVLLVLGPALTY